jgi:hypothetical protein
MKNLHNVGHKRYDDYSKGHVREVSNNSGRFALLLPVFNTWLSTFDALTNTAKHESLASKLGSSPQNDQNQCSGFRVMITRHKPPFCLITS